MVRTMETLHDVSLPALPSSDQTSNAESDQKDLSVISYSLDLEDKDFRRKQTKLTIAIITLWTIVQFITFLKNLFIYNLLAEPVNYASQLSKRAIPWITAIVFIFIINYSSKYFLKAKVRLIQLPLIHFILASFISISIYLFAYYSISIMGTKAFAASEVLKYFMVEIDRLFLIYLLISLTTTAHYYFHEIRTRDLALQKMQNAYRQSRIISLNNEVNPHMIFNTLNNIYTLISEDLNHAKNMIVDFADLLRENLRHKGSIYTTMTHEEEFLKNYVNLQNYTSKKYDLRFIQQDPKVHNAILPKMILQPLIENAIKHNSLPNSQMLKIKIKSEIRDSRLIINVSNNICANHDGQNGSKMGIGTENILRRLEVLYPNDFKFKVNKDSDSYISTIDIPFRE